MSGDYNTHNYSLMSCLQDVNRLNSDFTTLVEISSLYDLDKSLLHRLLKPGVVASGSIAWKSGMHDRAIARQVVRKCTSSSTAFLHNFQNLWSGGIPTYLPVSISNGAVAPLSHASKDRCALHHKLSVYPSGLYVLLRKRYRSSV